MEQNNLSFAHAIRWSGLAIRTEKSLQNDRIDQNKFVNSFLVTIAPAEERSFQTTANYFFITVSK